MEGGVLVFKNTGVNKCRKSAIHSEDGGLNDALKLARRVENNGVVASAALELSGSWATPGTATMVVQDELYMPMSNVLLVYSCTVTLVHACTKFCAPAARQC